MKFMEKAGNRFAGTDHSVSSLRLGFPGPLNTVLINMSGNRDGDKGEKGEHLKKKI